VIATSALEVGCKLEAGSRWPAADILVDLTRRSFNCSQCWSEQLTAVTYVLFIASSAATGRSSGTNVPSDWYSITSPKQQQWTLLLEELC
jgi:hypothetical protein